MLLLRLMVQSNAVIPLVILGLALREIRSPSPSVGHPLEVRGVPPLLALPVPAVVAVLAAPASVGLCTTEELCGGR